MPFKRVRCCHVLLGGHFKINQIISRLSHTVSLDVMIDDIRKLSQTYFGFLLCNVVFNYFRSFDNNMFI